MIKSQFFFDVLFSYGIRFYTGVPDSLLKNICFYIASHTTQSDHIIAANEGNALSIGIGYHLATGKIPLIYMQNSGLGNVVNPLMSLADSEVYSIPMLLMIGWRGEPNVKDEPQHVKQGRIMLQTLDAMEIPYSIIDGSSESQALDSLERAKSYFSEHNAPYAIIIKKGSFENYNLKLKAETFFDLSREKAIETILEHSKGNDIFVSTTGMPSRELFELRETRDDGHSNDFLTVGLSSNVSGNK